MERKIYCFQQKKLEIYNVKITEEQLSLFAEEKMTQEIAEAFELHDAPIGAPCFLSHDTIRHRYALVQNHMITIGNATNDTIEFMEEKVESISLERMSNSWVLRPSEEQYFANGQLVEEIISVPIGSIIAVNGMEIILKQDFIDVIYPNTPVEIHLMKIGESIDQFPVNYPIYHRSPRIILREPEDGITITPPPGAPSKPGDQLLRIIATPLAMLSGTILMSILTPRGPMAYIGMISTVVSSFIAIYTYITKRKEYKVNLAVSRDVYSSYITKKNAEITANILKQKEAIEYTLPDIQSLATMAEELNARIYEKTRHHADFLTARVGMTDTEPSFPIKYEIDEFDGEKDPMVELAEEVKQSFSSVPLLPYGLSFNEGSVGFVGNRQYVIEQLQLILSELSFFHSYHDVEFITVFPETEKASWNWARWLPHTTMNAVNIRGFIYHDRSRDQVLGTLYQILKDRKQQLTEEKEMTFAPHYVVFITDTSLITDHSIMELMTEDIAKLGVTLVYVEEQIERLPEFVKTVVDIRDEEMGVIILENGEYVNKRITLDHFPENFDKEIISRTLAPLDHQLTLTNTIPEAITFLEMYDVQTIEALDVMPRWQKNAPHKTLAVPLGVRGPEDLVYLNLHEKAHGPHGLVAGTTGSGKSEIVQSYILSLAVNFHPFDVAFLLIDYKGGGMANLFKDLPHHLGSITNLDGAQSMRALISIKAELQRRQRLFSENDVNHINQYQKLFKEGKVSDPMPHLFLISDEFAELKAEQPEFMKELVSTARIGRSLGIHLILATQKPSGVVDDQIWSNSKFKLALKVQDAADSNEMLKTPDAANITLPGRAYLQVGNNEIYELFQSAWSGANYYPNREIVHEIDTTVYKINELGQYEILTEDLSGLEKEETVEKVESELDAIIGHLHKLAAEHNIEKLPQPWLPPLSSNFTVSKNDFKTLWNEQKPPMDVVVGIIDEPHMQAQNPFHINLSRDGHLLLLASPGFGKSTTLQTLTLQLARQLTPSQLHMYLIDFGTNGLLALKELPHVADTIMIDDVEKVEKLIRRMTIEIKERKKRLSEYSVASLEQYEQASGQVVPNIVFVLDNYDAVRETPFVEQFESLITQVTREGASIGIHLVSSATRMSAMRVQIHSNIKLQLVHYLNDENESRSIVGRSDFSIEELPGRGMVKLETPTVFHIGLPTEGEDTLQIIESIKQEAKEMREYFTGHKPKAIPVIPEVLLQSQYIQMESTQRDMQIINRLPLGVDFEHVESISWEPNTGHLLIAGESAPQIEKYGHPLLQLLLQKQFHIELFDVQGSALFPLWKDVANIINTKEGYEERMLEIIELHTQRTEELIQLQQNGTMLDTAESYQAFPPVFVVINRALEMGDGLSLTTQTAFNKFVEASGNTNIHILALGETVKISKAFTETAKTLKTIKKGVLIGKLSEQTIFNLSTPTYREKALEPYEAYYIQDGRAEKIKYMIIQE